MRVYVDSEALENLCNAAYSRHPLLVGAVRHSVRALPKNEPVEALPAAENIVSALRKRSATSDE
jgi:hypothetical protein